MRGVSAKMELGEVISASFRLGEVPAELAFGTRQAFDSSIARVRRMSFMPKCAIDMLIIHLWRRIGTNNGAPKQGRPISERGLREQDRDFWHSVLQLGGVHGYVHPIHP